jgi:hypothetical protein
MKRYSTSTFSSKSKHDLMPPHTYEDNYYKKKTGNNRCGKGEKKRKSFALGGNVDRWSHYKKTVWQFSKKLKIDLSPYNPFSWCTYIKKMKSPTQRKLFFHVHYSPIHNTQDMDM